MLVFSDKAVYCRKIVAVLALSWKTDLNPCVASVSLHGTEPVNSLVILTVHHHSVKMAHLSTVILQHSAAWGNT